MNRRAMTSEKTPVLQKGFLSTVGSLLPSFLVSTCCLGPTVYVLFGVSVGGLSVFAPLKPYRPVFMVVAVALLGSAFYHLYVRPPTFACVENGRSPLRTQRLLFWVASVLFMVAALYPLVLPQFFS